MNTTNKTAIDAPQYLTIVYDVTKREDRDAARELLCKTKWTASGWCHAMHERDAAIAALAPTVQDAEPAQGMPDWDGEAGEPCLQGVSCKHQTEEGCDLHDQCHFEAAADGIAGQIAVIEAAAVALENSAERHGKKNRPVLEQIHRKHAARLRAIVATESADRRRADEDGSAK